MTKDVISVLACNINRKPLKQRADGKRQQRDIEELPAKDIHPDQTFGASAVKHRGVSFVFTFSHVSVGAAVLESVPLNAERTRNSAFTLDEFGKQEGSQFLAAVPRTRGVSSVMMCLPSLLYSAETPS